MAISKEFVLAGDSIFTIKTPADHKQSHRTYRVEHVPASDKYPEAWFVKLLVGSDNTDSRSYKYLGKLDPFTGQMASSAKSICGPSTFPVRLFNRTMARVWTGDHEAYEQHGFETMHMGRCGRCCRPLTDPVSVALAIGPDCWAKMVLGERPTLESLEAAKAVAAPTKAYGSGRFFDVDEAFEAGAGRDDVASGLVVVGRS